MHGFLEFLYAICYLVYCYLEAVFRLFVSKRQKSVAGKVVLVTGAGHGIGRQFALQFSRLGASLVLWDVNKTNNDAVAEEIRKDGGTATAYVCDVSKADDVKSVCGRVQAEVGDVDVLVNNAGILNGGALLDLTDADIQRTIDINTTAHFWTVRAFLPAMMRRKEGHIINVASIAAFGGSQYLVDYSASKSAVCGMTQSLRLELNVQGYQGIQTTAVCPTFVATGMTKYMKDRFGRILEPEEVAETAIQGALRGDELIIVPRALGLMLLVNMFFPLKFQKHVRRVMDMSIDPQYERKQE